MWSPTGNDANRCHGCVYSTVFPTGTNNGKREAYSAPRLLWLKQDHHENVNLDCEDGKDSGLLPHSFANSLGRYHPYSQEFFSLGIFPLTNLEE
jgi:hypothetical protein